MEALSLEAGGAISPSDFKVDVKRRGGLNICQLCVWGVGVGVDVLSLKSPRRYIYTSWDLVYIHPMGPCISGIRIVPWPVDTY